MNQIPYDDKNYTVVYPNGYRRGSMTREQAVDLARRRQNNIVEEGGEGKMKVYYRDGSPVDWTVG